MTGFSDEPSDYLLRPQKKYLPRLLCSSFLLQVQAVEDEYHFHSSMDLLEHMHSIKTKAIQDKCNPHT